jgi:hypothetical protein
MDNVIQTGDDASAVMDLLASLDGDGRLPPEKKQPAKPANQAGGAPKKKPGEPDKNPDEDDGEVQLEGDPIHDDENPPDEPPDPKAGKKNGDPEKVDYDQEIPMADGSTVKLGELKDAYQDTRERELDLQERENKMIERAVEQDRVLKFFDANLPPQLRYRGAQQLDEIIRRESEGVLDLIPTWRHEDARTVDQDLILELANGYGMKAEIAAELRYPSDRRVVKMLRDFARLKASVKQARAAAKQAIPPSSQIKPSRNDGRQSNADALATKAKSSHTRGDEIAAVEALLKG